MRAPTQLWNKDFTLWWLGTAQASLGHALAGIALSFLVLEQTGRAGAMGLTLALALLPGLLSPLAGTLVDRIPLKLPLVAGDVARGLIVGGVGLWALAGHVPLPVIYGMALLNGLIGTLYTPAAGSLLPRLVPSGELPRANGLMGSATQTASLIGLVGGGVLVGRFGSAPSLLIDALGFFVMAALLLCVNMPREAASNGSRSFWEDFRAGLAVMRASRLLILVPILAFFLNASIAPMEMLLPKRMLQLGAGAQGFGLFFGLLTGGLALGSVLVALLGQRNRPRLAVGAGLAVGALALLGMAFAPHALHLWTLAFVMGLALAFVNTGIGTLLQTQVESEFRGRVFSVLNMVGQIGMPITLLALVPVADRLALSLIFGVAGSVMLAGSVAWAAWSGEKTVSPTDLPAAPGALR